MISKQIKKKIDPANSKEKRAEHFIRVVKYRIDKKNRPGIGRWWLQSAYDRVPVEVHVPKQKSDEFADGELNNR